MTLTKPLPVGANALTRKARADFVNLWWEVHKQLTDDEIGRETFDEAINEMEELMKGVPPERLQ